MVVSKRCKICSLIDTDNVPISGEYFGKLIPDLILKTCGIEVDSRKANGVLICQLCIIQLVHTHMVIQKFQNAVHRLKKNVKEAKHKTPVKNLGLTVTTKATDGNKTVIENGDQHHDKTSACDFKSFVDNAGSLNETTLKTPKKVWRRKSVYHDGISANNIVVNKNSDEIIDAVDNVKFKKISDDIPTEETPAKPFKRKPPSSDEVNKFSYDSADPNPMKRNKTCSEFVSEESRTKLTVDELKGSGTSEKESQLKVKNCILCGTIFHSKNVLRSHIETAHMGERLKACPHCSSEFRSEQKYESHVLSEKCKNFIHACQYLKCNKRFRTEHKMELHMLDLRPIRTKYLIY